MDLNFKDCKGSFFLVFLIIIIFLCDNYILGGSLFKLLCGKSFDIMTSREYYRIFTEFLLNPNFLYVIANVIALFSIGQYIEKVIGCKYYLLIFFLANILVSIFTSFVSHGYNYLCGSSPGIYALATITFFLALKHNNLIHYNFVTFTGSFIVYYFLICNLVNLQTFTINISGVLIGIIALIISYKKWLPV